MAIRTFKDIEQVKVDLRNAKPLVELIADSTGTQPTRVHDDMYKMCCLFHNENTPSMFITPSKGLFYCFGCHAGGDEFDFLMDIYNISFIEAINRYAEMSGLDLTPYYKELTPEEQEKERMIAVLDSFITTAQYNLRNGTPNSNKALQYLYNRGFTDDTINSFRIGYADKPINNPDYTMKALELDRLDIFYDALIFPDFDSYGRPVRVYGRPFTKKDEKSPKYIGTSKRSPIYEYALYGFHIARKNARKHNNKLIVVEGQADTNKMHQFGFDNTAGLKGTIFNNETIKIFDSFKIKEVVLLLDGDDAGIRATREIVKNYYTDADKKSSIRLRIANIYGYDPDEFLNAFGRDKMAEVVNSAVYAIEYIINDTFSTMPYTTMTDKIELLRSLQPYINAADSIERNLAISEIGKRLSMDVVFVDDFFKSINTVSKYELYSINEERIILGECIRNTSFLIDIGDKLQREDFYLSKHQALFKLLSAMVADSQEIKPDIVIAEINNTGIGAYFGDNVDEYVKGIVSTPGSSYDVHIENVRDKSIRRSIMSHSMQLNGALSDLSIDTSQSVEIFNNQTTDILINKTENKVLTAGQQADAAMNMIYDRMNNSNKMIGFHIGNRLNALSQRLMGIQTKRLTCIAANQGVGKSKLLSNAIMGMAVEDPAERVGVLWFSYEMPEDEVTIRNLAILSGISADKMLEGKLTTEEHDILQRWAVAYKQAPIYMDTEHNDVDEALSIARKYILQNGVKVIAFDYIQLMTCAECRGSKKHEVFGTITKKLKKFAMKMDVSAIIIAQLGKSGVNKDLAQAEDIYNGYEIAQDSDVFIIIQRKSDAQIDDAGGLAKGNLLINLDKNRGRKDDQLYNVYADDCNARLTIV